MAEQIIKTEKNITVVKELLDKLPLRRKSGKAIVWRITCIQYKERRSTDQNSLMWRWWQFLEDTNGSPKEGYHEIFKEILCPMKPVKMFNETVMIRSTALLTTLEFTKYLETIHQYIFSNYGVSLELPPKNKYDEGIIR
jgi:hypothetical protein